MGRLLTAQQVAERTTLSVETLYTWRSRERNDVPLGFKLGNRVVWDEDEVLDWIDRQRGGAS